MGTTRKSRSVSFDIEIGRRVRVHRIRRGLKQRELARAIKSSYQQVQKYENGSNRISAGKLVQIADALRTPVATFFDGLGTNTADDTARAATRGYEKVQGFAATAQGSRLCRAFMEIESAKMRRHFLSLLEDLSKVGDS